MSLPDAERPAPMKTPEELDEYRQLWVRIYTKILGYPWPLRPYVVVSQCPVCGAMHVVCLPADGRSTSAADAFLVHKSQQHLREEHGGIHDVEPCHVADVGEWRPHP
jgi:hypothetical protein